MDYLQLSKINMVLGDMQRVKIIDMLSCKSLNAKELLESLDISQPTLSFHLNKLVQVDLVIVSKSGTKKYYSLNQPIINEYLNAQTKLMNFKTDCVCFDKKGDNNEKI